MICIEDTPSIGNWKNKRIRACEWVEDILERSSSNSTPLRPWMFANVVKRNNVSRYPSRYRVKCFQKYEKGKKLFLLFLFYFMKNRIFTFLTCPNMLGLSSYFVSTFFRVVSITNIICRCCCCCANKFFFRMLHHVYIIYPGKIREVI